ncbi:MAG: DUF2306 domain-containing protein [Aliihoeflea sp.]
MSSVTLLDAPLAVQFHVATVIPAAFLGAWLLARPKGTPVHRLLGKIWMGLMFVTAASTFFIHELRVIGDFSPIHLISLYVMVSCFTAVRAARRHNIVAHRRTVAGMYLGGIVVAGAFTFLPGRIMSTSLLALTDGAASIVLVALLAFGFIGAGMLAIREMNLKRRAV